MHKPVLENTEADWKFTTWYLKQEGRKKKHVLRRPYGPYISQYRPNHPFARKDGHVLEHRLVWEHHNKAILLPWANVHHLNGNMRDNRIENLKASMWHKPGPMHKERRTAKHLAKILKNMGL